MQNYPLAEALYLAYRLLRYQSFHISFRRNQMCTFSKYSFTGNIHLWVTREYAENRTIKRAARIQKWTQNESHFLLKPSRLVAVLHSGLLRLLLVDLLSLWCMSPWETVGWWIKGDSINSHSMILRDWYQNLMFSVNSPVNQSNAKTNDQQRLKEVKVDFSLKGPEKLFWQSASDYKDCVLHEHVFCQN